MIPPYFRLLAAALLCVLMPARPAASYEMLTEGQSLTGQATRAVLPSPPMRLGWTSPDKAFWINGESPEPKRDTAGQIVHAHGAGAMGARYRLLQHGRFALSLVPTIRAQAVWQEGDPGARQGIGGALFEELSVTLPAGFGFRARGGLGDRTGVAGPVPRGMASPSLALRGEIGFSGSLAPLGFPEARFDLQLISIKALGTEIGESRPPSSCELKLELATFRTAPLRIGGSCPGASGEGRVTLGIGGRF
ncbi:hypothetical protein [Muricoccus pecuniae]|uniref:Outer membrane protein beta-barrel domain-containing protein n=1 Tax=Muricoccus pecuniae TaxID=693023 RepID=A0A840YDZ6_9PROT|nr:hypothetical protein [Roseomonas pecuniae]MBB5694597.1 hypothetical protein [Roseomonas pecuniae]